MNTSELDVLAVTYTKESIVTQEEFAVFYKAFLDAENKILSAKGKEYTHMNLDRLHAFKTIANSCGLSQEDICQILLHKHMASINDYINFAVEGSTEDILERIHDARNYLLLLAVMIDNKKYFELSKNENKH